MSTGTAALAAATAAAGGAADGGDRAGGRGEDMARRRDAIHEIMTAPERLTITATESMVIVTDGDGRTTRLSLDGKKIKDESTGIERKTKWDGAKLTSEISGAGPGTMTQIFQVDPEHHQLLVTVQPPAKDGAPMPHRVVHHPRRPLTWRPPRDSLATILCRPRSDLTNVSTRRSRCRHDRHEVRQVCTRCAATAGNWTTTREGGRPGSNHRRREEN